MVKEEVTLLARFIDVDKLERGYRKGFFSSEASKKFRWQSSLIEVPSNLKTALLWAGLEDSISQCFRSVGERLSMVVHSIENQGDAIAENASSFQFFKRDVFFTVVVLLPHFTGCDAFVNDDLLTGFFIIVAHTFFTSSFHQRERTI
jgi:hypothetical protein